MKVRDLPAEERNRIHEFFPDLGGLDDLELEEFVLLAHANLEDSDRRLARRQRRADILLEIENLVSPVIALVGDLPLLKLSWFLHGAKRRRHDELQRELAELSQPVLVTHGRQAWHQAVEDAVGPLERRVYTSHAAMVLDLDRIATRVLGQNPAWPADRVGRYALYIIETLSGISLS
jgi:hypothetical protein